MNPKAKGEMKGDRMKPIVHMFNYAQFSQSCDVEIVSVYYYLSSLQMEWEHISDDI